jgi:copper chaperone
MAHYQFKTNIHCGGCKSAVSPFLDRETRITRWEVDINHPDKLLTVEGEAINPEEIIGLISKAGYRIELMK